MTASECAKLLHVAHESVLIYSHSRGRDIAHQMLDVYAASCHKFMTTLITNSNESKKLCDTVQATENGTCDPKGVRIKFECIDIS